MTSTSSRARAYWRRHYALTFFSLAISILFLAAFQASGMSVRLKDLALSVTHNYYLALFIYLSVFGTFFYLVMFPAGLYGGFILERAFSLSDQSLGAWLKDEAKKAALSSVVFLILVEALYAIVRNFPSGWWLSASLFWIAVSLILARIFPLVVVPLFFKYSPLSKEDLRARALSLAEKFRIKVVDVFEIDFSKKTKKANAAVIGWGKSRRIIMADNLVSQFTTDESVAVLAHEMGHHKLKHVWKHLFMGAVSTMLFFFILSRIYGNITDIALFPAIYLLFAVYSLITMPIENAVSRKFETDADRMALEMTGSREPFISMMERLAEKNLADTDPNPAIEFILYSHPSISKRIAFARIIKL